MKNRFFALFFCFFFGMLGIHRMYLGSILLGILYILGTFLGFLTMGISSAIIGIIVLIDFILLLIRGEKGFNKRYNKAFIK